MGKPQLHAFSPGRMSRAIVDGCTRLCVGGRAGGRGVGGERSRQPSGNVMAATGERVRYNCSHSKIIVQTPRRSSQPMSSYGATELAKAFRTVRGNTSQIARDMPEDKY